MSNPLKVRDYEGALFRMRLALGLFHDAHPEAVADAVERTRDDLDQLDALATFAADAEQAYGYDPEDGSETDAELRGA